MGEPDDEFSALGDEGEEVFVEGAGHGVPRGEGEELVVVEVFGGAGCGDDIDLAVRGSGVPAADGAALIDGAAAPGDVGEEDFQKCPGASERHGADAGDGGVVLADEHVVLPGDDAVVDGGGGKLLGLVEGVDFAECAAELGEGGIMETAVVVAPGFCGGDVLVDGDVVENAAFKEDVARAGEVGGENDLAYEPKA